MKKSTDWMFHIIFIREAFAPSTIQVAHLLASRDIKGVTIATVCLAKMNIA